MHPDREFTALTVDEFLDALAGRTPTPGGGSVIALSGSCATALARMIVAYSLRDGQPGSVRDRLLAAASQLAAADAILRALITRDAQAYAALRGAAALRKNDAKQEDGYQRALLSAATVPLEVAALCGQVLDILNSEKELLSRHLHSDLTVSAELLAASVTGAAPLLRVNATHLSDAGRRSKLESSIESVRDRARQHRQAIDAFVSGAADSS